MGYYTYYKLELINIPPESSRQQIIDHLRSANQSTYFAFDEDGETEEPVKWYDHEAELKEFSKNYPKTKFLLSGEGEDQGDQWRFYVMNGKGKKIKWEVVWPKIDFNTLE